MSLKQRVSHCLMKLSDRDTESRAVAELDAIARALDAEQIPQFLSAIADTRPDDKTPLRRQSMKLISIIAGSHDADVSLPHFPRMLSAALRRIRDGDSSVRSACIDAVRAMAKAHPPAVAGVILRPIADALAQQQDQCAQAAAALSLAAAVDECRDNGDVELVHDLQKLTPRIVKLMRSNAFKAKPALLTLLGSVAVAGGARTAPLIALVVHCLVESLSSEDWAARKAGAEALAALAVAEKELLVGCRDSWIAALESRRFDKVKIVRDSMNRLLDLWKDIPEAHGSESRTLSPSQSKSSTKDVGDVRSLNIYSNSHSATPVVVRNRKTSSNRSPPPLSSPIASNRKNNLSSRNKNLSTPLMSCKPEQKSPTWGAEIAAPHTTVKVIIEEQSREFKNVRKIEGNLSQLETQLKKDCQHKGNKLVGGRSTSRVVPIQETDNLDPNQEDGFSIEEVNAGDKDCDLSSIRMQLLQIENQQSYLMDVLQKFIGKSQNGIYSLETRVNGLEVTLDEISRDLAFSGRMHNDPAANSCCRLPGSEYLSPKKFWRRTEGRFSSRFTMPDVENLTEKESRGFFKWDKNKFGAQGGHVNVTNPLLDVHPQSRGSIDISSGNIVKTVVHDCATPTSNPRNY